MSEDTSPNHDLHLLRSIIDGWRNISHVDLATNAEARPSSRRHGYRPVRIGLMALAGVAMFAGSGVATLHLLEANFGSSATPPTSVAAADSVPIDIPSPEPAAKMIDEASDPLIASPSSPPEGQDDRERFSFYDVTTPPDTMAIEPAQDTAPDGTLTPRTTAIVAAARTPIRTQQPAPINEVPEARLRETIKSPIAAIKTPVVESVEISEAETVPPTAWVQLSAHRLEETAQLSITEIRRDLADVVDADRLEVVRADYGRNGIYHYVRTPAATPAEAEAMCRRILDAGGDCFTGEGDIGDV